MSNNSQRSRSAIVSQSSLRVQLNQSVVRPAASLRHSSISATGGEQRQAVERRAEARDDEVAAMVVLADQLGGKGEHAQRAPAEGVDDPEDDRDRHEQRRAQRRLTEPAEPQPQREGVERQRHRQREIHEAEQEREIIGERQREQGGRRNPAMDLAARPRAGRRRSAAGSASTISLTAGSSPISGASSSTSRSTPRLPISAQSEAVILLEVGRAWRDRAGPGSGPYGPAGRAAAARPARAGECAEHDQQRRASRMLPEGARPLRLA